MTLDDLPRFAFWPDTSQGFPRVSRVKAPEGLYLEVKDVQALVNELEARIQVLEARLERLGPRPVSTIKNHERGNKP